MTDQTQKLDPRRAPLRWLPIVAIALISAALFVGVRLVAGFYNRPVVSVETGILIHPWRDTMAPAKRAALTCQKRDAVARLIKVEKSGGWLYDCVGARASTPPLLVVLNIRIAVVAAFGFGAAVVMMLRARRA